MGKKDYYEKQISSATLHYRTTFGELLNRFSAFLEQEKARKIHFDSHTLSTHKDDFIHIVFDEIYLKKGIVIYVREDTKQKLTPKSKTDETGEIQVKLISDMKPVDGLARKIAEILKHP